MGKIITLTAADGHSLSAYEAGFPDSPRALVVMQEIFGVNHYIRSVCDGFGDAGYHVIAPAIFDRVERGVELGYEGPDWQRAVALAQKLKPEDMLTDLLASAEALGRESVGIIGYCLGGTLAWAAATKTSRFKAAVGWYGGGIVGTKEAVPNCPVQLHFGAKDDHIPLTDVEAIRTAQPGMEVFVYDQAGHGFGCPERASYEALSASLAQERSLAFLQHNL